MKNNRYHRVSVRCMFDRWIKNYKRERINRDFFIIIWRNDLSKWWTLRHEFLSHVDNRNNIQPRTTMVGNFFSSRRKRNDVSSSRGVQLVLRVQLNLNRFFVKQFTTIIISLPQTVSSSFINLYKVPISYISFFHDLSYPLNSTKNFENRIFLHYFRLLSTFLPIVVKS